MNRYWNRVVFILTLVAFGYAKADSTTAAPPKPTPTVKIDMHTDWFQVKYDDVRDLTQIKTKDEQGPGAANKVDDAPMKLALSASFSGKSYDPAKPVAVRITFNRSAGLGNKNAVDNSDFKPFKSNQLLVLDSCKDLIVLLPSGQRVPFTAADNTYKNSKTTGFMGEMYLWESLSFDTDTDFLSKLQDGGKMAVCDQSFAMNKDQISQVRSLLAVLNQLAPKPAAK